MNWLKDRKNLPIVIVLVLVVIGGATFGILFAAQMLPWQQQAAAVPSVDTVPAPPPKAAPSASPRMTPAVAKAIAARQRAMKVAAAKAMKKPVAVKKPVPAKLAAKPVPGAPGAAKPGDKTASAKGPVDVASGPDPFRLPKVAGQTDTTANDRMVAQTPPVPNIILTNWRPPAPKVQIQQQGPVQQSDGVSRRMAGVLFGDGVYAILESSGKTEAVQPGDSVEGGKVVSIAADHLTIKTDDDRLINVPLSGTPTGGGNSNAGFPGGGGGFPGGGFPGAQGALGRFGGGNPPPAGY